MSAIVEASVSLDGGVVVILISPCSLTRNRNPMTAISAEEVILSIPEKSSGSGKDVVEETGHLT